MSEDDQDIFESSTGVKLRIKTPSALIIQEALKGINTNEPTVPMVYSESKGRDEPNPNDPDYLVAKQRWQMEAGIRGLKALIPTGTELVSKPGDLTGHDAPEFADLMASMGIEPATGNFTRYVQWVMFVACAADDLNELGTLIMRRMGVSEEDVAEAIATFRGSQGRRADNGDAPPGRSGDGDNLRAPDAGPGTDV